MKSKTFYNTGEKFVECFNWFFFFLIILVPSFKVNAISTLYFTTENCLHWLPEFLKTGYIAYVNKFIVLLFVVFNKYTQTFLCFLYLGLDSSVHSQVFVTMFCSIF